MSNLQEVQAKGYEILNIVVDLCEKYNLNYYLISGTLLGSIRHGGFIPWDNDIDIALPIKDYRKLLKIAKKQLPSHLFVQNYVSDPGYNEMWTKIRANGTTSLPLIWKDLDIHWGIGIDVFPLIGLYETPLLYNIQQKLYGLCRLLLAKDILVATNSPELNNRKLRLVFSIPRFLRITMCQIMEAFIFKRFGNSKKVTLVYWRMKGAFDKEAFDCGIRQRFESREFVIPKNYDHVLTEMYGDYLILPPEAERNGHEGSHGKIIYDCVCGYQEYLKKLRNSSLNSNH